MQRHRAPALATAPRALREPVRERLAFGRGAFVACLLPILWCVFLVSVPEVVEAGRWTCVTVFAGGGIAWWIAVALARAGCGDTRAVVVGAIALRLIALVGEPRLSDDVYRYVWEGTLVSRGISPYAQAPADPALAALAEEMPAVHARINHPQISAAYPPFAQLAFAGVVTTADAVAGILDVQREPARVLAMRIAFALCDLLCLLPLGYLLRRARLPRALSVVWAWSPLVVLEFGGSGHFDSLGILTLVSSLALFVAADESARRGRRPGLLDVAATLLLAASIWTKLLPICAVPFALRGPARALRAAALCVGLAVLAAPLLLLDGRSSGLLAGLTEYGVRWEGFHFVYSWIEALPRSLGFEFDRSASDPRLVARGIVVLLWVAFGAWTFARTRNVLRATRNMIGAYLFLTPVLHPWYVTWIVPLLALQSRRAWMWLALTIPLTYVTREELFGGAADSAPQWLWPVICLPFAVLIAYELRVSSALRRRRDFALDT